MALTPFQRRVCRLIARHRIESGESYVAGGAALNELLASPRLSRDIDLFHDTDSALASTWSQDRALLLAHGFDVRIVRDLPAPVEAEIALGPDAVLMEWARDSAFRFFPLVTHPDFGLTLHPIDLATNKVLALVGRLEARDWIDLILCSEQVQPLGYLAWAACGKDPGFSPAYCGRRTTSFADRSTTFATLSRRTGSGSIRDVFAVRIPTHGPAEAGHYDDPPVTMTAEAGHYDDPASA